MGALVATIIAVSTLHSLGVWQLYRMDWKTKLLGEIDRQYQTNTMQTLLTSRDIIDAPAKPYYLRGTIKGRFIGEKKILIGPRNYNGELIQDIVIPFKMQDGSIILVKEGWIDHDAKIPRALHQYNASDQIQISGTLTQPDYGWIYKKVNPPNIPSQNIWRYTDIEALKSAHGLKTVLPAIMQVEAAPYFDKISINTYSASKPTLNNNHLKYAIFWFVLGEALIVIFILRFVIKKKPPKNHF